MHILFLYNMVHSHLVELDLVRGGNAQVGKELLRSRLYFHRDKMISLLLATAAVIHWKLEISLTSLATCSLTCRSPHLHLGCWSELLPMFPATIFVAVAECFVIFKANQLSFHPLVLGQRGTMQLLPQDGVLIPRNNWWSRQQNKCWFMLTIRSTLFYCSTFTFLKPGSAYLKLWLNLTTKPNMASSRYETSHNYPLNRNRMAPT